MGSSNTVKIFDTTLRDGGQCRGNPLTPAEKLRVAQQLARLQVDIIEAGFAASSPGDFEAVRRIAGELKNPVVASLARAVPNDVDQAWEAIKGARQPRIHV
ncbi:MAG: 2-isopropylmalate synthase, partial [Candidatus Dadabacteria bacterium]|nr:2-isopropylmalate synthase [Candidatus Dadabacteria bacterium]